MLGKGGGGGRVAQGQARPLLDFSLMSLSPDRQVLQAARCVVCARHHPTCNVVISTCCVASSTIEDVTALPVTFLQVPAYLEQLLLDHCRHIQSYNMLAESITLNHLDGQLRFSSSDVEGSLSIHKIEQRVTVTECPLTSWISRSKRPGNCYSARPPPRGSASLLPSPWPLHAESTPRALLLTTPVIVCGQFQLWPIGLRRAVACRSVHAYS